MGSRKHRGSSVTVTTAPPRQHHPKHANVTSAVYFEILRSISSDPDVRSAAEKAERDLAAHPRPTQA